MPTRIGKQAVVVGAGMAGLIAARSLADFFERVIVLEYDALPKEPAHRPRTPQSRHGLLAGGLQALSRLFLKLPSAYRNPELVQRVKALMAEAQTSSSRGSQ